MGMNKKGGIVGMILLAFVFGFVVPVWILSQGAIYYLYNYFWALPLFMVLVAIFGFIGVKLGEMLPF